MIADRVFKIALIRCARGYTVAAVSDFEDSGSRIASTHDGGVEGAGLLFTLHSTVPRCAVFPLPATARLTSPFAWFPQFCGSREEEEEEA